MTPSRLTFTAILTVTITLLLPPAAFSHGGRTDFNGGHNDRKNGGYHYHNSGYKKKSSSSTYSSQASYTSSTKSAVAPATIDRRIGDYFRKANENVGTLNCSVTKTRRFVTKSSNESRQGMVSSALSAAVQ